MQRAQKKKTLSEVSAENFPNLWKDVNIYIQEAFKTQADKVKKTTSTQHIDKFQKVQN